MFDPDRLYPNTDKALDVIAPASTRNHWRSEGRGPAFIKLGQRVAYSGKALNEWLVSRTVHPGATGEMQPAA